MFVQIDESLSIIHFSCYNEMLQTEQSTNNMNLLTVLEAGKSEFKVPAHLVSGESRSPLPTQRFLLFTW